MNSLDTTKAGFLRKFPNGPACLQGQVTRHLPTQIR